MSPRQKAIQNGDKFYEGKPCKKGHTTKLTSNGDCIECKKQQYQDNKEDFTQYNKQWYQDNRKAILQKRKQYAQDNKESIKQYKKQYAIDNKESIKQYQKQYAIDNEESITQYKKQWSSRPENKKRKNENKMKRYYNDPIYRLKTLLSSTLGHWCKQVGSSKGGRTQDLLGYTAEELKTHLESLFQEGMTWDNQGDWHIDHIIPQSYFTSIDQIRECFALSNLKPEWGEWNMSKGNRFIGSSEDYPSEITNRRALK